MPTNAQCVNQDDLECTYMYCRQSPYMDMNTIDVFIHGYFLNIEKLHVNTGNGSW